LRCVTFNPVSIFIRQLTTNERRMNMTIQTKILRKAEVIQITGLSNTSIFERTKDGLFPTNMSLGGRSVGYFEHEILALLTARAAGRTDEQIRELVSLMIAKRKEMADAFLADLVA
jgi:prophage regulatory protein